MPIAKMRNKWVKKLKKKAKGVLAKTFPTSKDPQPGGFDYNAMAAVRRRNKALEKIR